jgi:hypothetical protein
MATFFLPFRPHSSQNFGAGKVGAGKSGAGLTGIQWCYKTKSFRDVVSNFYLEDKSICFSTFAAREGIKKRTPIAERKIQNEKRRLNRDRLKLIVEDQPGCTTPSTTEGTQSKTKNTKLTATQLLKAILFNSNYNQTDFFYFKYCLDTAETSEDENLGKIVFIDTYGARGRKFCW